MRIGIACYPTYGGSGVLATELGLALAARGHEIHLFSYARPARLAGFVHGVEFHNVSVSSYPLFQYPPYDLALSSVMRQVMVDRELDVLHVHYAVPHAICAYVAREMIPDCRTRIVTTLHGTDATILGRDPSYREVIRFGLEKSDAVVSVSHWLEQQTREVFDYAGDIRVISNFVDQLRFRPRRDTDVRRDLGGDEYTLVVHMSNFRPLKRAPDTVEVFRHLDPSLRARLVLAGDGPDAQIVRDGACRAGLGERVRFLGEIENVESIMAASDVALFPSESESFGLAALEAMACGLPVVASRVGGLPEVVVDGESGFLTPVGDTRAMAAALTRLLRDPELRRRMGEAGMRRASERFSLPSILEQHEALYAELLGELPGQAAFRERAAPHDEDRPADAHP
ncbi:MAG: N-acetyl-alpha-D-glucosaminyl L-malate synthase BshA [Planctomycetes bacterium]|nr:N-acetyl-alpha-D-glucosaminyl L-malate synthase BshA [Planctomycetota bacterium]